MQLDDAPQDVLQQPPGGQHWKMAWPVAAYWARVMPGLMSQSVPDPHCFRQSSQK
jgi:hypothetical protein